MLQFMSLCIAFGSPIEQDLCNHFANPTWAREAPVGLEDGVMTAFEATGLSLQGTDFLTTGLAGRGFVPAGTRHF